MSIRGNIDDFIDSCMQKLFQLKDEKVHKIGIFVGKKIDSDESANITATAISSEL